MSGLDLKKASGYYYLLSFLVPRHFSLCFMMNPREIVVLDSLIGIGVVIVVTFATVATIANRLPSVVAALKDWPFDQRFL